MKNKSILVALIVITAVVSAGALALAVMNLGQDFIVRESISRERLRLFPVPSDFRNYFLLQSIDDTTKILIGDFVGAEKVLCLVTDEGGDNTVDGVIQYYPDNKKFTAPAKPTTGFFTNLKDIKQDIIDGTIFRNSYSNKMVSLSHLKQRLEKGTDIFRAGYGYSVKVFDPDKPSTIMSEFYFSKKEGRYDLIFTTYYYMIFRTRIYPAVYFSVYCRNTKDPVVAETVESLLKLVPSR